MNPDQLMAALSVHDRQTDWLPGYSCTSCLSTSSADVGPCIAACTEVLVEPHLALKSRPTGVNRDVPSSNMRKSSTQVTNVTSVDEDGNSF